jgi:hypothetical protein
VAIAKQLIQPLRMLDVGSKAIQEHNIKEDAHDFRQRRIRVVRGFILVFEIVGADAHRQDLLRAQANEEIAAPRVVVGRGNGGGRRGAPL